MFASGMRLFFVACLSAAWAARHCDVVIIGGGGGGAHLAVFAKDNGKKVCVVENQEQLGGHCTTRYFSPPVNNRSHIELGFQLLHNTSRNNERGFHGAEPYLTDMVAHVQRFTEITPSAPFLFNGGASFVADPEHGIGILASETSPALVGVVQLVANYLRDTYPFLEDGSNPDVIPEILLLPIPEFFQTEPFLKNFAGFFTGTAQASAIVPFANISAFHALRGVVGSFLMSFIEDGWMFTMKRGCREMYDNITTFLRANEESENVFLSAIVTKITRPSTSESDGKITVHFVTPEGMEHLSADHLVIAVPPTLQNLNKIGLSLSPAETHVFEHFEVSRGYYSMQLNVSQNTTNFYITTNTNLQDPLGQLNFDVTPIPNIICDVGNQGPCNSCAVSIKPTNLTDTLDRVQHQLDLMAMLPTPIYASVTYVKEHTGYFPHPSVQVLQNDPAFYGKLNALQGQRNTIYVGAGSSYPDRTLIIEQANRLAQRFFPAA